MCLNGLRKVVGASGFELEVPGGVRAASRNPERSEGPRQQMPRFLDLKLLRKNGRGEWI